VLGIALLLVGATITGVFAILNVGGQGFVVAVILTVVQLAAAIAAGLRLPAARCAAIALLIGQLAFLLFIAYIFLVLTALPLNNGDFLDHPFNPVALAIIVAAVVAEFVLYFFAWRSAWQLRPQLAGRE
jgi:hypothetical protein